MSLATQYPASMQLSKWKWPALVGGAFILLWAFVFAFQSTFIDDAYIQFTFARNLITNGTWGMIPGHISNTATSPLNILLLSGLGLFLPDIVQAATWLTALEYTVLLVFLLLLSRQLFHSYFFGIGTFLAALMNPLLLSTLGMESLLVVVLVVACCYFFTLQKWTVLAICLGLLTLARPDGTLYLLIFLCFVPKPWRNHGRIVLIYSAVLLPWLLFSWIYLGSLFPDTFIIKTFQEWRRGLSFVNGLLFYLRSYPVEMITSFMLLPLGLLTWKAARPVRLVAGIVALATLIHFSAYSILQVPPYHWYYSQLALAAVFLGMLGLATVYQRHSARSRYWLWAIALTPMMGLLFVIANYGLPLKEAPIHTNWAAPARYQEIGLWLGKNLEPGASIIIPGEIGALAYYSNHPVVSAFSDMNYITQAIRGSPYMRMPVIGPILKLNYLWRDEIEPIAAATYVIKQRDLDPKFEASPALIRVWSTPSKWTPNVRLYLFSAPAP